MATPLVIDLGFIRPGRMIAPRIVGGAVEGGATLSGAQLATDVTGGGFVAVDYENIQLGNSNRDRLLFFNRLATALHGGVRACVVPLLTDYIAPCKDNLFAPVFGGGGDGYVRTPFADGSTFSDGAQFAQPPVSGAFLENYAAGAGTVNLTVVGGRALQGGEWFGVEHANKSFRAYCVTDIDEQIELPDGSFNAAVAIRPVLRDLVVADQRIDWWRPRCLMRIKSGAESTLLLQQFWYATPSLSFVEAF